MKGNVKMLNSVNNNQPSFGMALRKPATADMRKFTQLLELNHDSWACRKLSERGLKQVIKENRNNPFDIVYNAAEEAFNVLSKGSDTVLRTYRPAPAKLEVAVGEGAAVAAENVAKKKQPSFVKQFFRVANALIFNPKAFLPTELNQASRYAGYCHRQAIKAEQAAAAKEQKLINAVRKAEDIFRKA